MSLLVIITMALSVQQADGTKKMVKVLEQIASTADPRENLYLNQERAELTRQELEGVSDKATRARGLYLLAPELLLSGQTVDAIESFKELDSLLSNQTGETPTMLRRDIEELLGLAYLRLGEQQNCLDHNSVDACILPIAASGVHRFKEGSRRAIAQFEKILLQRPDNVTAKWLLNLAYMTIGEFPSQVPQEWRINENIFTSNQAIERFKDNAPKLGLDVQGLAGGVVIEDLDQDGDLDIVCSSWGLRDPIRVFRNDATHFVDVTDESGLTGIVGGLNLVHADYNNDNLADILVLRGAWWGTEGRHPNSLLKNTSKPGLLSFQDVTHESKLLSFHPTQTAAWADYNHDGWLDLFIGNESEPSEFFRNDGDGTFTEIAAEANLSINTHVKGVTWGDFNNDSYPDLYISSLGAPNQLFQNNGHGKFKDVTNEAGVAEPMASFPTWFFDYDNDGWLDLFVSGYSVAQGKFGIDYMELSHKGEPPRLYRNQQDGTFSDETENVGLGKLSLAMGSNFGDLNNDGFLDFYLGTGEPDLRALVPNRMYQNEGGKQFTDVTMSGGFGHLQKGHGIAFADLDHDGDQDIYAVMGGAYSGDVYGNVLFENPGQENNWILLSLSGTRSNRSAIGSKVQILVRIDETIRTIHTTINTGGSFGSTSLRKTIGLGSADEILELTVFWPTTGTKQVFKNLPTNNWISIEEDNPNLSVQQLKPLSTFK